jgi:large repetitive protein
MAGNLGYQSGWTDPQTARVNMAERWYSRESRWTEGRHTPDRRHDH